jgi:prevent-host-death family protein
LAMKKIPAGQFKAKCLSIMDRVQKTGEAVLITKHGKPVVQLLPAASEPEDVFGYMAGKVKITPLDDWETK